MNRLVIVGNGFDLASGLKSSFSDFVKFVLATTLEEIQRDQDEFSLSLLVEKRKTLYRPTDELRRLLTPPEPYFENYYELISYYKSLGSDLSLDELISLFKEMRAPVRIVNDLLRVALKNSPNIGWADFEEIYSNELEKRLAKNNKDTFKELQVLNQHLSDFKESFTTYLIIQQNKT